MSAADQMRAMLDQLMGTSRDGEKSKNSIRFDDSRVCKSFLLGCCPCDILSSTRMDLGECQKIHDIALRADFESASKTHDYYYDIDVAESLQSFINECDRKTELAKRRLKETQEDMSEEAASKVNAIHALGEQIGTKLARAEGLGAEGMVDESLKLMEEVEELKKQKVAAENDYRNTMPASNYQQQKLRVCEVCSAYLGIHDNDRRLADHFGGKLHVGFITLRQRFSELQETIEARRQQREKERLDRRTGSRELSDRKADESGARRSRSPRRSHSRRRSRSRSEKRRRSRSDSRERSRNRRGRDDRRKSSERGHRSSRDKRSRSRSRNKHSSRRSRSRSRSRRSRSRSRRRSGSGSRRRGSSRGRDRKSSPKKDYLDY